MLASFFFFNDTATTEIYTLSLHDALPISTTNTGQLNWVGSTWATASAPPPAAPMASAMNTYSASATPTRFAPHAQGPGQRDRKSTRLNSSHGYISYAVFCLKKKKK